MQHNLSPMLWKELRLRNKVVWSHVRFEEVQSKEGITLNIIYMSKQNTIFLFLSYILES